MTLDEFIVMWKGKDPDFDGVYPNQCMDLMHQYIYQVLGLTDKTTLAARFAVDVYKNFSSIPGHEFFERINNTPINIPTKGDIVFFDANIKNITGEAGHVCIFFDGDTKRFQSFDANFPTGTLPHLQDHKYVPGCLGWLRYKNIPNPQQIIINQSDAFIAACVKLGIAANKDILLSELDKFIQQQDLIVQKDREKEDLQNQVQEMKDKLATKMDEYIAIQAENESLKKRATDLELATKKQEKDIENMGVSLKEANIKIETLEKQFTEPPFKGWKLFIFNLLKRG